MKKVQRFGVKRKLAPRFVGPYKIIEKKGPVAYKLQLPEAMGSIFPVFQCITIEEVLAYFGRENRTSEHSSQIRLGIP